MGGWARWRGTITRDPVSEPLTRNFHTAVFACEGEDFGAKGGGGGGLLINLPQRERKRNYDVDEYFRDALRVGDKTARYRQGGGGGSSLARSSSSVVVSVVFVSVVVVVVSVIFVSVVVVVVSVIFGSRSSRATARAAAGEIRRLPNHTIAITNRDHAHEASPRSTAVVLL